MDAYRCQLRATYALALLLLADRESSQSRRRLQSCWTKEWLLQKETRSHMPLLMEIRENNLLDYRNFMLLDEATFQELLTLVSPYLQRKDTSIQRAIPAEDKLVVTLRFLATGWSLADLKFGSVISPQALGLIIPETCKAIITVQKQQYLKVRKNKSLFHLKF